MEQKKPKHIKYIVDDYLGKWNYCNKCEYYTKQNIKCNCEGEKMKIDEKINCWIADYEDTSLLQESIGCENVKNYLIDEAMQIFNTIKEEK